MRIYIIYFLLISIFTSCTERKCSKTHEEIIPVGDKKEIVKVINDCDGKVYAMQEIIRISKDSIIHHGYYKEFYSNGKLKVLGFKKNNLQDSISIVYNENGDIDYTNFFVKGVQQGFQDSYFSNGKLRNKNYLRNDSTLIFRVIYKNDGSIDSLEGIPFDFIISKDTFNVEKPIHLANEIVLLDNIKTVLKVQITNERNLIFDSTITRFEKIGHFYAKLISFTPHKSGTYKYKCIIEMVDNKKIIKSDTLLFKIYVDNK